MDALSLEELEGVLDAERLLVLGVLGPCDFQIDTLNSVLQINQSLNVSRHLHVLISHTLELINWSTIEGRVGFIIKHVHKIAPDIPSFI